MVDRNRPQAAPADSACEVGLPTRYRKRYWQFRSAPYICRLTNCSSTGKRKPGKFANAANAGKSKGRKRQWRAG